MQRVWFESLSLSDQREVEASAGHYVVRAYLPSGELVLAQADVAADDAAPQDVVLRPESVSPRESLAWAYVLKGAARVEPNAGVLGGLDDLVAPWLCLWERTDAGEWAQRSLPPGALDQTIRQQDGRALASLRLHLSDGQHWLQVGAADAPSKFIALPPSDMHETRVLLLQEERPDRDDLLQVTVDSGDSEAEAVLGYLSIGAFDAARRAERLLYRKSYNPAGAAIGGYYLLRAGDLRRLHDWTANLANWFPWLPDGAVIRAWHLLRQPEPDRAAARELLLEAVRRGIPIYTQGLRLLYDGLSVYYSRDIDEDSAVRAALERIGPYAAAADWQAQTTTFYAQQPTDPDPSPSFYEPNADAYVIRLDG